MDKIKNNTNLHCRGCGRKLELDEECYVNFVERIIFCETCYQREVIREDNN